MSFSDLYLKLHFVLNLEEFNKYKALVISRFIKSESLYQCSNVFAGSRCSSNMDIKPIYSDDQILWEEIYCEATTFYYILHTSEPDVKVVF